MLSDKTPAILLHIQTRDHASLEYKKQPKVYTDASLTSFGLFHTQTTPYASGHSL